MYNMVPRSIVYVSVTLRRIGKVESFGHTRVVDVSSRAVKRLLSAWIGNASSRSRCVQPRSLSGFSLMWIGRSFVRFTRECVVFSCVALRVSLMSDVARCFGRFAETRGQRRYRSRFSSYKSCSVRRHRRFSFSSIALSCPS